MKIIGMLAACLLCATMLSAQHAKASAAKPASASSSSSGSGKSILAEPKLPAAKPEPNHAAVQRATGFGAAELHARPIEHRPAVYWQNLCFNNPSAAVCQGRDFAVRQTPQSQAGSGVAHNPFAVTGQPSAPSAMMVNQTVYSAPGVPLARAATPVVKVSDEVAAGVVVGASLADVRQKLGEPHSQISGGMERYTYFLQSGASLKLDFEDGHVTQVRKVSN